MRERAFRTAERLVGLAEWGGWCGKRVSGAGERGGWSWEWGGRDWEWAFPMGEGFPRRGRRLSRCAEWGVGVRDRLQRRAEGAGRHAERAGHTGER